MERLMRNLSINGVVRGKKIVATNPDSSQRRPDDKANRLFDADRPNQLWISDFSICPNLLRSSLCRFRQLCLRISYCQLARIDINAAKFDLDAMD